MWQKPVPVSKAVLPAVADDLDGDGGLDLAVVSEKRVLTFVSGATGRVIAVIQDARPTTDLVAVDPSGKGPFSVA